MLQSCEPIQYIQFESDSHKEEVGEIIAEVPVLLSVNGESWLTFMCTPDDLEEMAVGFLYNERVIETYDEVEIVRLCNSGHNIDVWLKHNPEKPTVWRRTSGCTGGITSVGSINSPSNNFMHNGITITPSQINSLIAKLFSSQDLYQRTGGVHTSAMSDGNEILIKAEDIGRHNTLDKIAGKYLINNMSTSRRIIITTGRISSEMLQKSVRIGAPIIITRTSPSSLSIQLAEKWGVTLIGYARRSSFRAYSHVARIVHPENLQKERVSK